MDVEPPTGDDLNRMLVSMKQDVLRRAAAEPPARRRPWARRHLGLTLGLVALLGVGGAGGALALVLPSPFRASPAATSSPSPAPTREPVPGATATVSPSPSAPTQPAAPTAALAIDCATLGQEIGVEALVPTPSYREPTAPYFSASNAMLLQAGVLDCLWQPEALEYSSDWASVRVSPAGDRGREWLSGLQESGLPALGVGDVSAISCPTGSYSCNSSIVAGTWWIEVSAGNETPGTITTALIASAAQRVVAAIAADAPGQTWSPPSTMWSSMTDCSAMPSGAEIGDLVGTSGLLDAEELQSMSETGIHKTQDSAVGCEWWRALGDQGTDDEALGYVSLEVAPGGGWAYGSRTLSGSPVDVAGADAATAVCYSREGASCWIDALVDDTWIQINGGTTPETQHLLIPVAEAVIAAQAASAGQG